MQFFLSFLLLDHSFKSIGRIRKAKRRQERSRSVKRELDGGMGTGMGDLMLFLCGADRYEFLGGFCQVGNHSLDDLYVI